MTRVREINIKDEVGLEGYKLIYVVRKKDHMLLVGVKDPILGELGDIICSKIRLSVAKVTDEGEVKGSRYIDLDISDVLEMIEYLKIGMKSQIKKELKIQEGLE